MTRQHRNQRGNMLVLIICISAAIFIPSFLLITHFGFLVSASGRAQNVVEAAGLVAAKDISRIVINDPDFGYVSLSNRTQGGKATKAADGEPLPVYSINTLIGTLRQNAIVADELKNDALNSMVDQDFATLQKTANRLKNNLNDSLSEMSERQCFDSDGEPIDPVEDVKKFLAENLPENMKVESVHLSLGWLQGGSESNIEVPKPEARAQVSEEHIQSGQYEAFTPLPVGKRAFSFAGLGSQAHMVSSKKFQADDDKHVSSIIKIECVMSAKDQPDTKFNYVACCQPSSQPDNGTRGAMTVRVSGVPVPGLSSWHEFLSSGNFHDNGVTTFNVVGGDFPLDKKAQVRQEESTPNSNTPQQFAEHLYYWLRNGRGRATTDAILTMLNEPFDSGSNLVYTYEFEHDGKISRRVSDGSQFTRSVVADGQTTDMADTHVKSGANAVILFRDNVKELSARNGKHAGQPLASYPTSNSGDGSNYEQMEENFSKRKDDQFGLAVDIEIGGTAPSTANDDVISMKNHPRVKARSI